MSAALRILALLVLLPAVLAGCTAGVRGGGDGAEPRRAAAEVPVVFRIVAGGRAGVLLDDAGRGVLALRRDGAEDAREVSFANGAWTPARLAPGRWEITHLGPLRCRGLGFDVAGEGGPRILGTLRVEVLETSQYLVALMASVPTHNPAEALAGASAVAEDTGASPPAADLRPLAVRERAPCFLSRGGEGQTFTDRPPAEQALLAVGFAAFCALAVASGGFCVF